MTQKTKTSVRGAANLQKLLHSSTACVADFVTIQVTSPLHPLSLPVTLFHLFFVGDKQWGMFVTDHKLQSRCHTQVTEKVNKTRSSGLSEESSVAQQNKFYFGHLTGTGTIGYQVLIHMLSKLPSQKSTETKGPKKHRKFAGD